MRNLTKILLLFCIIVLAAFSCEEKENVDAGEFELVEIKKITDFGCEDCNIKLKAEYTNNSYYVIKSQSDLTKYVTGENIPVIDFEKYLLIMGIKQFSSGVLLYEEEVKENNIQIVYTLIFRKQETTDAPLINYYVIIEKPIIDKEVKVNIEVI